MSVDAVAVLSIPATELRKRFAPVEKLEDGFWQGTSAAGEPFMFQAITGGSLVHLAVSYEWTDADLSERLHALLGEHLRKHREKRGVLLFPDAGEPDARSYSAIVAELGQQGRWLKLKAASARRKPDFPGMEHMTFEELDLVRAAPLSGDPAKVAAAEKILQRVVDTLGGEERFQELLNAWLAKHR